MSKTRTHPPPFGAALKRYRIAAGLTHEALAERAALSPRTISDLERGVSRSPRQQSLSLLIKALALTPEQRAVLESAARPVLPLSEMGGPFHNLPAQATRFIGREREIAVAGELVRRREVRLVTLTGAGGAGKTRLAIRVAELVRQEFVDGAFFVPLAPAVGADSIIESLAQAIGVGEVEGFPLEALVIDYLRERQVLLILDNFEHLLSQAPLVAHLSSSCPRVKALVTSRAPLHLTGEHELLVAPLPVPDLVRLPAPEELEQYAAIALFVDRAASIQPEFRLTPRNGPAVAAICVRVDGLPLAIELAAARVKLLPPHALLAQLERPSGPLRLLTGGARDLPARQQALRDTIAWSYDLLTRDEQRLLRRLAVFAGGCTLVAAATVVRRQEPASRSREATDFDLLDGLASLIDKSLLRHQEGPDGQPRYLMLETIREFALEQLEASAEAGAAREAHARYYLGMVEASGPFLLHQPDAARAIPHKGPGGATVWQTLGAEQENIRTALRWLVESG